jgi:type I restriction enzyme S subunit
VSALDEVRSDLDSIAGRLDRQLDLLLERRQALITAAVTGQFAIPGVAA